MPTEKITLDKVNNRISSPEQIHRILKQVEKEIVKASSDIADSIRQKEVVLLLKPLKNRNAK